MKADLATSIFAAVVGVVAAYLVCNMFLPPLTNVSFSVLSSADDSYDLENPSDEVFNFRALNPTVEVYVGSCSEYDENGECLDDVKTADNETEDEENAEDPEQTDNTNEEN